MIRFILASVLLTLLLRGISRFMRGLMQGMQPPRETPPPAVPLVRDPVCGTFVVPANALTVGQGSEMRFFCSEKCRRAYQVKLAR